MKSTRKLIVSSFMAVALTSVSAQAATITWTVSTITNTEADVSNAGTKIIAASGSDGGATANVVDGTVVATVNGVAFTDDFTLDTPSHFDTLGNRANATGAYLDMIKFADRQGSGTATWSFTGLNIGNTYQFQVWYSDDVSVANEKGLVMSGATYLNAGAAVTPLIGDSGIALLLQEVGTDGTNAPGQFATGTFVADAATQTLIGRAYKTLTTTPALESNLTINAYQLRDLGVIPEPSTALLGGLGLLALLRRRR